MRSTSRIPSRPSSAELDAAVLGLVTYVDTARVARVTSKAVGTGGLSRRADHWPITLVIHVVPDSTP